MVGDGRSRRNRLRLGRRLRTGSGARRKRKLRKLERRLRLLSRRTLALGAAALAITGCGSGSSPSPRDQLAAYVSRVEPIRLRVNRLLDRADPTLSALNDHRLAAPVAQRRLSRLERRFAADAVRIGAVAPVPPALRNAQRAYAHTYVLEDSYLSALVAALPDHSFDNLPHTQTQQRAAITAWRIQLELQATKLHLPYSETSKPPAAARSPRRR